MPNDFQGMAKALQIDDKIIGSLDALDKKIQDIAKSSDTMAQSFKSAMTVMTDGSNTLLQKLTAIQSILNAIGSKNATGLGKVSESMGTVSTASEKAASSISGAMEALNKFGNSGMNIAELRQKIKSLNDELRKGEGVRPIAEQQNLVDYRKQLQDELKAQEKANSERIAEHQKMLERIQKEEEKAAQRRARLDSRMRRSNYTDYVTSTEGSLRTADKATTYNQRAQALKNLEAAINRLRTTDANYERDLSRLTAAHNRLSSEQRRVEDGYRSMEQSQRRLMNTGEQLQRQLALLFSVSAIEGYITKLIQVRGEFELQNTALASILGNKNQADKLFSQVTQLAVQSPYTIKELTTYTKSLSAYSVEYEKLYDTLKMLADVASGLGVDMQRLILAFGQVKAANFLRGTETRQFTEAGINMLGELAKYYTELEGRIVSVSEVQDRQFRRMISFQDVEQVFKRLTSEGGMFFNMQERQAETLAGQWSNLKDRLDLMLNEIGKANDGALKGAIQLASGILENYDAVITTMQAAGAAFVAYKLSVLETSTALLRYAKIQGIATSMQKQLTFVQLLHVGWNRLATGIKTAGTALASFAANNAWLIGLSLLTTAIYEAIHWNDEYNESMDLLREKNEKTQLSIDRLSTSFNDLRKAVKGVSDETGNIKINPEITYSTDDFKSQLSNLQKLIDVAAEKNLKPSIPIELVTPENIDEVFDSTKKNLDEVLYKSQLLSEVLIKHLTETDLGGLLGENLGEDMEDLSDAFGEISTQIRYELDKWEQQIINIYNSGTKIPEQAKQYYDELRKGRTEQESILEWEQRRYRLLNAISKINVATDPNIDTTTDKFYVLADVFSDLYKSQQEVANELDRVIEDFLDSYGGLEKLRQDYEKNPMVINATIKAAFDQAFENRELSEQAIRFSEFYLRNKIQVPIELVPTDNIDVPKFYNDFRDAIGALDKYDLFDSQLKSVTNLVQAEDMLKSKYKELEKELDVLNRANTKRLNLEEQIKEEESKLLSPNTAEAEVAQIKINNLKAQKGIIDEQIESTKELVSLQMSEVRNIAQSLGLNYKDDSKSRTSSNPELETIKKQLNIIKQVEDAYRKYRKYMSESEASDMAKQLADGTVAESIVGTLSLDTSELIKGLELFSQEAFKRAGEKGKEAADEVLRDYKEENIINIEVSGIEKARQQIDSIFQNYEMSLELNTKGIDVSEFKEMLKSIGASDEEISYMGLDVTSFEEAQNQLREKMAELQAEGGEEQIKLAKETQEQLTALEIREANKRFAELLELRQKYQSRETKISKIETDISGWQAELDQINKMGEAGNQIRKEWLELNIQAGQDEILRLKSEALQLTQFWRTLFGDLGEVSVGTLKDLLRQREEIISNATPQTNDQGEIIGYSSSFIDSKGQKQDIMMTVSQFNQLVKSYKNVKKEFREKNPLGNFINSLKEGQQEGESFKDFLQRLTVDFEAFSEQVFGVASSIMNLTGASESTQQMLQGAQDIVGGTMNAVSSFASGNVLGVVQGLVTAIGGIFKIGDAKKEKKIQREIELVENLEKAYEKLEEAIDNAYSIDTLGEATDKLAQNTKEQIESYKEMIKLEEDKKSTDEDRIKEWEEQIAQLEEELAEIYTQNFNKVTGDILSDVLSAADEFTNAWLEAFNETGNGMSGLENNFDEMITNMLKRQAAMLITSQFIEQWKKQLEQYIDPEKGDLELTTDEAKKWVHSVTTSLPQLNEALKAYFEAMKEAGVDLDGDNGDQLTGLQRGIESITHEQSDALQALLESIRFFVSDERNYVRFIYNILVTPMPENPFLAELRLQSNYLSNINSILFSLMRNVPSAGRALKVQIV